MIQVTIKITGIGQNITESAAVIAGTGTEEFMNIMHYVNQLSILCFIQ